MNRHYKTLELDKILKLLADQTSIDDAKEMALSLEPQFELEKVKKLLKQTDDAVVLSGKYGTPSFGGAKNCANALRRAEAGGCLSALSTLKDPETRKRKPQPAMPASPEVWTAASACPHSARQRPRRRFAARRPAPENRDVGLASRQKALRSARWMLAPSIHRVASHTLPPLRDPRRVPSWESLCKATRAHRPEPALALGRAAR